MKPLEALGAMQDAIQDLIERHLDVETSDGWQDDCQQLYGMEELLTTGPAICDKDRHALEMWVLSMRYKQTVEFHQVFIGDDTEPLPPIFAEVEAMIKNTLGIGPGRTGK